MDLTKILPNIVELGLAGITIAILAFFVYYLLKELKQVRNDHRADLKAYRAEDKEDRDQTRRVLENLTGVIEHINRK